MERYVIEELVGANVNDVEGVTNAPSVVKNLTFKRRGGYVPLGGRNQSWLPSVGTGGVLDENSENILLENGSFLSSEWVPTTELGNAELIAYDEGELAFFNNSQVWLNNLLNASGGTEIENDSRISLVPRVGVITPWRRLDGDYLGESYYLNAENVWTSGEGAGTASFTENAGTGLLAGTYEFVWVVEAPTNNGLVVHSIGQSSYVLSAEIESLTIDFSLIYAEGSVVRLYYRRSDQPLTEASYERFAIVVCDGLVAPSGLLADPGTFVPTEEVLLNFSSHRLEAHNERIWGVAAERPFTSLLPNAALGVGDGYMIVSGGTFSDTRQYGTVALANMGLRTDNDYIELTIPRLSIRRVRTDLPHVVELFSNQKSASTDQDLFGYLQWDPNSALPRLIVKFAVDSTTAFTLLDEALQVPLFSLGERLNSELIVSSVVLTFEIKGITPGGSGDLSTSIEYSVQAENMVVPTTVTTTGYEANTSAAAAWTTYSTAAATTLGVGRLPVAHTPAAAYGIRELRVSRIETGNSSPATVYALGLITDYDPSTSLTTWTSSSPNAETWTTTGTQNMILKYLPTNTELDPNPFTNPELTLIYSDTGSINRGKALNFVQISALTSTRITALASTAAGLLVFLENETFLVRGDPATNDFGVQRLSGTVGCDDNVIPARLGSVVMPIYKGEVYAINLGGGDVDFGSNLANVSSPVWLRDDWFVQVVGENYRNQIVGLTESGKAYRLDTISQQWLTDLFSEVVNLRFVIPACNCNTYGTRYNVGGFLEVIDDSLVNAPVLTWRDMDLGDKNLQKLWRRIEVMTGDTGSGTVTLTYDIRGQSGTVTGIDQGDGRWVFTMPRGIVGPKADLEFTFTGATTGLVIEPPVVIEFQPRYRER